MVDELAMDVWETKTHLQVGTKSGHLVNHFIKEQPLRVWRGQRHTAPGGSLPPPSPT